MMRKGIFAAALLVGATAFAGQAEAQLRPWEISIAGGPSAPRGDIGDEADTGYHVQGSVGFDVPMLPVGLRADAFWQELPDSEEEWFRQIGVMLNGTAAVPLVFIEPYLLAGVGFLRTETPDEFHAGHSHNGETVSAPGFNVGAGLEFPFMGLSGFVEGRYLNLLGSDDAKSYQSIPVTFGIRF